MSISRRECFTNSSDYDYCCRSQACFRIRRDRAAAASVAPCGLLLAGVAVGPCTPGFVTDCWAV